MHKRGWIVSLGAGLAMTLAVLGAPSARAAGPTEPPSGSPPIEKVLADAEAHANDPGYLGRLLSEFEARLAATKAPSAPERYAHAWLLASVGKASDAVAEYDRAFAADPTLTDAGYNAGVALGGLGREAEAIKRFEAVLKVDPKFVDAAYNAGQSYYNLKNFKRALALWSGMRAVAPDDFDLVKKVLQAQNALGDPAAVETRAALIALRKASREERVRGLKEFCFDQFDVGKAHVLAYETFDVEEPGTASPDLYYVYTYKVVDRSGTTRGSVNLESSTIIREHGTPYILGASLPKGHKTFTTTFSKRPKLAELKAAVTKLVRSEFASVVAGK